MGCMTDMHSSCNKKTYYVATYLKYQSTVQKSMFTKAWNYWPIHLACYKE